MVSNCATHHIFSSNSWEKHQFYAKCQYIEFWRKLGKIETGDNFFLSKIRQDQKSLIFAFAYLFTAIVNNSFLQGKLGTRSCPHPVFGFSHYFLISKDNSNTKSIICIGLYILYKSTKPIPKRSKLQKHNFLKQFLHEVSYIV